MYNYNNGLHISQTVVRKILFNPLTEHMYYDKISLKESEQMFSGVVALKKIIVVLILLLFVTWSGYNAAAASFLGTPLKYHEIYVMDGDTLWQIAARYVTDQEDIRELIWQIRQINHLDKNASIYPGQKLKIPIRYQDGPGWLNQCYP